MARREDVTVGRALYVGLVAATALSALTGCSDDDDPTEAQDQPVLEVETATDAPVCMQVDETLPAEVENLPIIDCAQPHSHEIYATLTSEEDVYPGVEALGDDAEVRCLTAFEQFVGTSVFDSQLSYTWLVPSLAGWNDEDDREILCVLTRRDQAPMTGTMKDARI